MSEFLKSITTLRSNEWREYAEQWWKDERRFRGGPDVKDELVRLYSEKTEHGFRHGFHRGGIDMTRGWHNGRLNDDFNANEKKFTDLAARGLSRHTGESNLITGGYEARRDLAVWPALQRLTAEKFVGRLFQDVPNKNSDRIGFGALGDPNEEGSPAAQIWERANGTGDAAASMWSFFEEQNQWAMVTGSRWIMIRSDQVGRTRSDERTGARPYLQGISPLDVVYHSRDKRGNLELAVIRTYDESLRIEEGLPTNKGRCIYTIMTRRGFMGLGPEFSEGGFVTIDETGSPIEGENGEAAIGTWQHPGGEIPLVRFWYDKFGSSVVSELGNISSTIMNLDSWALYDIFQAAKRLRFFGIAGDATVDEQAKSLEVVFEHLRNGDPYIGVPIAGNSRLTVYDSGEVTANTAILAQKESVLNMARDLLMKEITTGPRQSGSSQEIKFEEGDVPRLASMAGNFEQSWTQTMRMMERIWIGEENPRSYLEMPREYKLEGALETLTETIEAMAQARISSPELMTRYVLGKLRETGEISENEVPDLRGRIHDEVSVAYRQQEANLEQQEINLEASRAAVEAARSPESLSEEELAQIRSEIEDA